MTLQEAINVRTSRRHYLDEALDGVHIEKLEKLITEYNQLGGFRIQLVLNNGEAFAGFTRSYGMLSGVRHYLGFIADSDDPHADEKIGYYGELLVLLATTLGLGTCWIGGTFKKSLTPFKLGEKERLACLITIGNVEEAYSSREKFIHKLTHRKTKQIKEMFTSDTPAPEWFLKGMEAALKAPSARNKQPVKFTYENGRTKAAVKDITKFLIALDLGIAKLHFELGSGGGNWKWGNGKEFVYEGDNDA